MQGKSVERAIFSKRLIISSLCWHRYVVTRLINSSRVSHKTHYETLGLENDCSSAEIKAAFIRLSKEVHPDKNPENPNRHQQFIQLNEAYTVLSRPDQRRLYDAELTYQKHASTLNQSHYDSRVVTNAPPERVIFRDESLWEHRDRSKDKYYEGRPYYGVPGIEKRLPNSYILCGIFIFTILGAIFHFFIAKRASDYAIEQLDRRDKIASLNLKKVRNQAMANGNELQIALIRQKSEADNHGK